MRGGEQHKGLLPFLRWFAWGNHRASTLSRQTENLGCVVTNQVTWPHFMHGYRMPPFPLPCRTNGCLTKGWLWFGGEVSPRGWGEGSQLAARSLLRAAQAEVPGNTASLQRGAEKLSLVWIPVCELCCMFTSAHLLPEAFPTSKTLISLSVTDFLQLLVLGVFTSPTNSRF